MNGQYQQQPQQLHSMPHCHCPRRMPVHCRWVSFAELQWASLARLAQTCHLYCQPLPLYGDSIWMWPLVLPVKALPELTAQLQSLLVVASFKSVWSLSCKLSMDKRSAIWKYFTVCEDDKASCNGCRWTWMNIWYNDVNGNNDARQWHCFKVQSNYLYSIHIRPNYCFDYSYSAE